MRTSTVTKSDLIRAGFSQDQARVLHDYLQDRAMQDYRNLASSSDLKALSSDVKALGSDQRREIAEVRTKPNLGNSELRQERAAFRSDFRKEVVALRYSIVCFHAALLALMITVMTYFNHR